MKKFLRAALDLGLFSILAFLLWGALHHFWIPKGWDQ